MPNKIKLDAESEQAIRARLKWQREKFVTNREEFGAGSGSCMRLQAYICALEWVLEEAGLKP